METPKVAPEEVVEKTSTDMPKDHKETLMIEIEEEVTTEETTGMKEMATDQKGEEEATMKKNVAAEIENIATVAQDINTEATPKALKNQALPISIDDTETRGAHTTARITSQRKKQEPLPRIHPKEMKKRLRIDQDLEAINDNVLFFFFRLIN